MRVDWLNYHHLQSFWLVAREGSVQRASELLHVTPASVRVQVKQLERALKVKLVQKQGRGLALTVMGEPGAAVSRIVGVKVMVAALIACFSNSASTHYCTSSLLLPARIAKRASSRLVLTSICLTITNRPRIACESPRYHGGTTALASSPKKMRNRCHN